MKYVGFANTGQIKLNMMNKALMQILLLIIAGLLSLSAFGQTDAKKDAVTLKLKVYLESSHAYSDVADNLTVRVDEMIDKTITESEKTLGRFSLNLSVDKHYVLYFSQEGYQTKSMVFSTVGADKDSKYVFRADVMLKRSDADNSEDRNSMASVKYDYLNKNEFVINENYTRIQYSVRK